MADFVGGLYERREKDGSVDHVFYVPGELGPATAKGTTPSPNAAKSDSQGIGEPTGAMSPASRAPTPASVPESQVLGSAQVSAAGEGDSPGDLEAQSWKDNTAVQAIGGFAAGLALGAVPFAGLGERIATTGGALPKGTMAAQIGKSLGEILGGLGIAAIGGAGSVGGAGLSATGIGAVVGVPAVAISSSLVVGGLASAAAGVQGLATALTTGSGTPTTPADTSSQTTRIAPESLTPTHKLTMSRKEFCRLKADIAENGFKEPIKFVEHNGKRYVVDGHHRARVACELGMKEVPAERVQLTCTSDRKLLEPDYQHVGYRGWRPGRRGVGRWCDRRCACAHRC